VDTWKASLADMIDDLDELLAQLNLDRTFEPRLADASSSFPLRVPREFVSRMRSGDINDPLLRQILPIEAENEAVAGFGTDPLGEHRSAGPMIQKYDGRVLIIVSSACAVHCRYCFRRHFPYEAMSDRGWQRALIEISEDSSIKEVILSGGDPLLVDNNLLGDLFERILAIPHVQRLRVHTRLPIVIPSRVDDGLLKIINRSQKIIVVVHINHANEIDDDVRRAMHRLSSVGVVLLNQSVLLRGVNDTVEALVELSEALIEASVLPYYLHLLDRVKGAHHFEVPEETAGQLVASMRTRLPGYLVPRLVREVEGAGSKVPVG